MLVIRSGLVRHCSPIVSHARCNLHCLESSHWPLEPVLAGRYPGTPDQWPPSRQSCLSVRVKIK